VRQHAMVADRYSQTMNMVGDQKNEN